MSNPKEATPVGSVLHTVESAASAERTEDDMRVGDPEPEVAVAVLRGREEPEEPDEPEGR